MNDYSNYPQTPLAVPQTSTLAIVSLVSGIATWVVLPLVAAIVAVITGHMARNEIRHSAGRLSGDGLALAGLVLGYAQLALLIISICLILALVLLSPAISNIIFEIQRGIQ